MSKRIQTLTDSNFEGTTRAGVTLVDFWAPWCGPCRMQGPILETVAERVADRAQVAKLNVDEAPEVAARFGVGSIPTLVVLRDGEPVEQLVGVRGETELVQAVDRAVSAGKGA